MTRVKGALVFIGAVGAAMIIWHTAVRLFTIHHPDNPAAQALNQLM